MMGLANSLSQQGKYAEAEAMDRQTLQLGETVLGKEHPDTLGSMNNLAESLRRQGKYVEAEAMDRQTLQLKETVLGKDHPETFRSRNNLARTLSLQGKHADAEAIFQQEKTVDSDTRNRRADPIPECSQNQSTTIAGKKRKLKYTVEQDLRRSTRIRESHANH
ncbi:hypothetical protein BP5796_12571 [Coleophoma crateriformis]|uniref:Kinesin light chain n=1 Tax=Coleophoma crateriformis TaxID=565419 RepID=A0A3D8Q7Y1_9HELO|nr:hypothetical protein BP5796_12571 [Coleophoma crateriformis]